MQAPAGQDQALTLTRAFRLSYGLGLVICVAWPLALQLLLGTAILQTAKPPAGVVQQLGYSFSGLTLLSALFVTWRWGKVRAALPATPAPDRPRTVLRETVIYSALFELASVYGVIYYALGGPLAERYARSFIALTTIMFFVFVPRLQAWVDAAQGE